MPVPAEALRSYVGSGREGKFICNTAQIWAVFFYGKGGETMPKLTEKQKAWIDYYKQGHTAAEAARLAGYKAKSDKAFQNIGSENLGKLGAYIADREEVLETPRIADMKEINTFWTDIMRDEDESTKNRLKASELRAKAAGAFIEKLEHSGSVDVNPYAGLTTEELRKLAGSDG